MASRSEKEAKRSAFWGGMIYIPVSLVFLFIGTALFSYYSSGAAMLPITFLAPGQSEGILPYFIVTQLPAGIAGLLIAAIMAAGMSTISTSFNSFATVFLTDYYERFFKKEASEKNSMKVLYISSAIIGVLGMLIAYSMIGIKSVLDTWWKLASIFSGGMLGLFLLAAFSKTKNAVGALVGVVVGLVIILYLTAGPMIFKNLPGENIHGNLVIVIGTCIIFLVGFLITCIMKKKK